jgi:hypothetical protein
MQGYKMFVIFSTFDHRFGLIAAKLTKFNPKPNLNQTKSDFLFTFFFKFFGIFGE